MTKTTKLINAELVYNIVNDVISVNHNLIRWAKFLTPKVYNESAKQSLNMVATFLLLQCAKEKGFTVDESRIPFIALKRLIEKTVNGDIRDDHLSEICNLGGIEKCKFESLIEAKILGGMTGLDEKLLEVKDAWIETRIYKIATKMATLVELGELAPNDEVTKSELCSQICSYGLPEIAIIALNSGGPEFRLLKEISKLRGAIRWLKQYRATDCSVLEHLRETAIFAWLMSMEEYPEDEVRATKLFWCGLFHDLPERWTGDMASPIKDAIEGLRTATEKFEYLMMEKNVYSVLPKFQSDAIKNVLDFSEEDYKRTVKGADYAFAAMECFRNIMCGSRDEYFTNVLREYSKQCERFTESFARLIVGMYSRVIRLS